MNKKLNTVLFILGATLFNVIVAVISFIILLILFTKFITPLIPPTGYQWGFTLIFLSSIAISIAVYRVVLRYFLDKIEIEKYFDPLFVKRPTKKPNS
ncbi:MAG: leader peptide processing enzyme [Treponema sp.]|jgi:hypothetical protein|nr:leader peptide processing enzyme [Treponema sp.]